MCVRQLRLACLVLANLATVDVDEAKRLCKRSIVNELLENGTPSLEMLALEQSVFILPR